MDLMKAEEMFKNLGFWSRKRNDTEIEDKED